MKYFILFLIASTFFITHTFGQGYTSISGRVLDAQTQKPLVGMYLEIPAKGTWTSSIGILSDENGHFALKFPTVLLANAVLKSTKVGYQTQEQSLATMKEKKDSLVIVAVKQPLVRYDSLDVRRVVNSAMARMETLYPVNPYWLTGFYRESLRFDDTLVKITEGVLKIEKTPAPEKGTEGEYIKLLRGRRFEKEDRLEEWESLGFGNSAALVTRSLETKLPDFLEPAVARNYQFFTERYLTYYEGNPVFTIRFAPQDLRVKGGKIGQMLVDTVSLGILSITYEFTPEGLKDVMKAAIIGSGNFVTEMKAFTVTQRYHQTQGLYYLQEAHLGVALANRKDKKVIPAIIGIDFYATEVNSRLSTHLKDNELIGDTLFPKAVLYQDNFWLNFNFLKLEDKLKSFFLKK